MSKSPFAPQELADESVFLVEATLKGIRDGITSYNRVSATSDELVNTLATPWSDASNGINYLSRAKLNTYSQCEPDHVLTGRGHTRLASYSFQTKLFGQWEAVEWALRPNANGFQKRFSFAFSPDRNLWDQDVNDSMSMGLLQGIHDFQLKGPNGMPCHIHPDGYALSIFRTVLNTVSEWQDHQEAQEVKLQKFFMVKLNFAFSDILRFAAVEMRKAQYLQAVSSLSNSARSWERIEINAFEMMAAVHKWLRQLSLHLAYYCYYDTSVAKAGIVGTLGRSTSPCSNCVFVCFSYRFHMRLFALRTAGIST